MCIICIMVNQRLNVCKYSMGGPWKSTCLDGRTTSSVPSLKTVILLLFSASSRRLSNTSGCAKASPAVINLFILMKRVDAY